MSEKSRGGGTVGGRRWMSQSQHVLCAHSLGRGWTSKLGFLTQLTWQLEWSRKCTQMGEQGREKARKGSTWGRAFSETHWNPGRRREGYWNEDVWCSWLGSLRLSGWPRPFPLPAHRDAVHLIFPLPQRCPSPSHSLPSLACPLLPAPSMLAQRPLIPKHPPFLCEAIIKSSRFPTLIRVSSYAFKWNKVTFFYSQLTRSLATQAGLQFSHGDVLVLQLVHILRRVI